MWHSLKVMLGISAPSASAELAAVIWVLASAITHGLGGTRCSEDLSAGFSSVCSRVDAEQEKSGPDHQSHEGKKKRTTGLFIPPDKLCNLMMLWI